MSHYYDERPDVKSDITHFTYTYKHYNLKLATDSGVFSKGKIDFGSDLLVRTFLKDHTPGPTKRIVDVGCGYGPIGLMLAQVAPHDSVTLVDVNQRALELTKNNAQTNQLDNVTVHYNDGLADIADESQDYVVTNPPIRAGKTVVHGILEDAFRTLVTDGALFVVIQKKQGMASAKKKMEAVFGNVEVLDKSKGYYILKSSKG
ncbi:class I SAM-dependent methyltransferase [Staphylococcus pettenkoferi]|uniref:Class I SAM-dependent methyltransferase n=1 Tax=Staphylococcus pettenkoferi TaxID=170573 RepID=A0ABT4BL50_9STAP|nr:class I SAM-dependent methyltransferase [Staphylococcus pettenkoferi]MCI2804114.1 class I SAM-dependent methyltransferase [Staphylococcus pettenkoferi]MCY1565634.1 class I SAM-dependent methyltransferase [Staphylococcus pettenkoferi]MCY1571365.1 class I SAM-dependent methyltransferase [Staphylococcus pettenkoferi]MCY1583401.1 class I SAM-dependent methyltransferase [Staphylococcus pettenkoferi]MCY1592144.1 class I SAM-dependent methyltransferase [Staphylococcus pettenkoferi]